MTPTEILATLASRGARLLRLDGNRLAVEPRSAVDYGIRQAIRDHKPELLVLLRMRMNHYEPLLRALLGDIGTPTDLHALAWAERHGWPDILRILIAADRRCEQLALADDETELRNVVRQLVDLFRAIRGAYAAHAEARNV